MENEKLVEKVQALTDIELAILLCLVGGEHCMIQTDPDVLEALQEELQLIASNVFGLAAAVIQCSETTTLDEFSNAILVEADHLENDEEDFINARKVCL
ncbi:hypothetical protein MMC06_000284 [Schaereria dolodes]|nr:hypothetical protein [Schaereria dolodes]